MRAGTRVNAGQAPQRAMREPTHLLFGEARPVPIAGHTLHPGSGVADTDRPCLADIRGRPVTGAIRPSTGTERDGCGETHPSAGDTGHREAVDGDLSSHFGEIPHAGPMESVARRVSDGRMPGFVKTWPGCRRRRTTGRAAGAARTAPTGNARARRRARRFPPAGQPCMRRFILGWKLPGHARRLSSGTVNHPDDFRLPGKAPVVEMPSVVRRIMERPSCGPPGRKPDACGVPKRPRVSGIPRGTQLSLGWRRLHRHPPGQGERQGHLPQGQ